MSFRAMVGERSVVLSLSGGKDSTAAGLWLQEQGISFEAVFNDTGWEHDAVYEHLDVLAQRFGPVRVLRSEIAIPEDYRDEVEEIERRLGRPSPMVRWCVHKAMFPSRLRRWCTQELKARPFIRWAKAHPDELVNVVGIRRDESRARSEWPEWAPHPDVPSCEVWAPLIGWSVQDVIDIHHRHGVTPCRLYLEGASRVGCWPCIMSNRDELRMLARDDRRVGIIRDLEALVGRVAEDENRKRQRPAMFQAAVARAMPDGTEQRPCVPIDDVLGWAMQAPRRPGQIDMFAALPTEVGCARWGLCDTYNPARNQGED